MLRTLSRSVLALSTILIASLLTGCAGAPTKSLAEQDRAAIKSVKLNASVQLPPTMFYHGRAQSAAAVGGIIGAMIGAETAKGPSEKIVATLKEKRISLQEIVKAEFKTAAGQGKPFHFTDDAASADAELTLTVNLYGFGQTQGFSSLLYPTLNVSASLKKKDGTVAWQNTEFATPHNGENKHGHTFDAYMANPELLRQTLTDISAIVSRMLVKDLQK